MTVGEYPDKVPRQWLIPPAVFESEYDIGRFPDVAMAVGVDKVGLAGGSIIEDFDGDGLLDIVASSWGLRDQLRFFKNDGRGRFTDRTREAGLARSARRHQPQRTPTTTTTAGRTCYVIRGGWLREAGLHPDSLLRNNGDGTFEDVTEAAGLLSLHPTHSTAWGDYDNDGWLDLFAGHEDWGLKHTSGPAVPQQPRRHLHRSCARRFGLGVLGVVEGRGVGRLRQRRLDRSLRLVFGKPNLLFRNEGGKRFTDVTGRAGVAEPVQQLSHLVLRLRQRRLARSLRRRLRRVGEQTRCWHSISARSGRSGTPRLYRNGGTARSRTSRLPRNSIACS